jgi:hypothetical protein
VSPASWDFSRVADALAVTLSSLESDLQAEQAPHGLDAWEERRFHDSLAIGLATHFEVAREVHYPSTAGWKLPHRQRCDLALTPLGFPLRREETLPLPLCAPENALWLEVKLAHQFVEGGRSNRGYSGQWREVLGDLRKMCAEPSFRSAALVLIVFTADLPMLDHDLAGFNAVLEREAIRPEGRHVRSVPITERIGHSLVTVALWELPRPTTPVSDASSFTNP